MQWVHLHSHNHLHYKLGLLFQKALKDPEHVEIVRKFKDEVRNVIGIGALILLNDEPDWLLYLVKEGVFKFL